MQFEHGENLLAPRRRDEDDRALLIIHKVQANFDITNPFKAKSLAEKPNCRLKLDCVIWKRGSQGYRRSIHTEGANGRPPRINAGWVCRTQIGKAE